MNQNIKQAMLIGGWIFAFAGIQAVGPRQRCTLCCATIPQPSSIVVRSDDQLRTALSNIERGTTLKIAPGVYKSGYSVVGVDGLTLEALNSREPPEFRGGNVAWHFSKCSHLTLRNLRCSGQSDNGLNIDDGGQLDRPVTDLLLDGLQISDVGPKGNHDGIKLSGVDRFVVRACSVHGWAGQGIDMVGCHEGQIEDCRFEGKEGFSASAGVQTKGGSADIKIRGCTFINAGERPVNVGGSTGPAYFRPQNARYEAARITVTESRFEGSICAAAFVGVDGARFANNEIKFPTKWIFRILQESTDPRFVPCRQVVFEDNCIVFRREQVATECNVGGGTQPESLVFTGNHWLAEDRPEASKPRLPVPEQNAHYGSDCRNPNPK